MEPTWIIVDEIIHNSFVTRTSRHATQVMMVWQDSLSLIMPAANHLRKLVLMAMVLSWTHVPTRSRVNGSSYQGWHSSLASKLISCWKLHCRSCQCLTPHRSRSLHSPFIYSFIYLFFSYGARNNRPVIMLCFLCSDPWLPPWSWSEEYSSLLKLLLYVTAYKCRLIPVLPVPIPVSALW